MSSELQKPRRTIADGAIITKKAGKRKFADGDRVARQLFMEDGTWTREGDSCLPDSPITLGRVVNAEWLSGSYFYTVHWDDFGVKHGYLDHGLTLIEIFRGSVENQGASLTDEELASMVSLNVERSRYPK